MVTRTVVLSFVLLFATHCYSQESLPDQALIERAKRFSRAAGSSAEFGAGTVVERTEHGQVHITDKEVFITLRPNGEFLGFHDLSAEAAQPLEGAPKFASDDAAWTNLEQRLSAMELQVEPNRRKIQHEPRVGGKPPVIKFTMHPRPYGYRALGGNRVQAQVQAVTGKLMSLMVGSGWTYEEPNIRITEAEAKRTAANTLGGEPREWEYTLTYETSGRDDAPAETRRLYQQKVMRLCYNLGSDYGSVLVDTVTGDVVDTGIAASSKVPPMKKRQNETEFPVAWAVGSAVLVLGGLLVLLNRLQPRTNG